MKNINDLTIAEMEEIEKIAGQPFTDIADLDKPRSGLMKAIAYTIKKSEDPKFTLKDAGEMTLSDINALIMPDGFDEVPKS